MSQPLTPEQARQALDEIAQRRDQATAAVYPLPMHRLLVPAVFILGCAMLLDAPMTDLTLALSAALLPVVGVLVFLTRRWGVKARPRANALGMLWPEMAPLRSARGRRERAFGAVSLLAALVGVVVYLAVTRFAAPRWSWPHTIGAVVVLTYLGVLFPVLNRVWARWVARGTAEARP